MFKSTPSLTFRLPHSVGLSEVHSTHLSLCLQHLLLRKKYEKSRLLTDHREIDRKTWKRNVNVTVFNKRLHLHLKLHMCMDVWFYVCNVILGVDKGL